MKGGPGVIASEKYLEWERENKKKKKKILWCYPTDISKRYFLVTLNYIIFLNFVFIFLFYTFSPSKTFTVTHIFNIFLICFIKFIIEVHSTIF